VGSCERASYAPSDDHTETAVTISSTVVASAITLPAASTNAQPPSSVGTGIPSATLGTLGTVTGGGSVVRAHDASGREGVQCRGHVRLPTLNSGEQMVTVTAGL
jgi:hypothetical protein